MRKKRTKRRKKKKKKVMKIYKKVIIPILLVNFRASDHSTFRYFKMNEVTIPLLIETFF